MADTGAGTDHGLRLRAQAVGSRQATDSGRGDGWPASVQDYTMYVYIYIDIYCVYTYMKHIYIYSNIYI